MSYQNSSGTTAKTSHYLYLDALRGIAAVSVLLLHWLEGHGVRLFGSSHLAVDFFFMLSGFVMAHSYGDRLRDGFSKNRYLLLRLVRLYPLILLGTVLGLIRMLGISALETGTVPLAKYLTDFFMTLAMIPNLVTDGTARANFFVLDSPLWSLHFELLAYVVFAFLLFKSSNRVIGLVSIVSLIGIVLWLQNDFGTLNKHYPIGVDYEAYMFGLARIGFSFTAGVLLYRNMHLVKRLGRWSPVLLTVVFIATMLPPRESLPPAVALFFLVAVFPFIIGVGTKVELSGIWVSVSRFLGDLSFPLYVLHVPIIWSLSGAFKVAGISLGGDIWNGLLILPITIISSHLAFKLYDKPTRKVLNRLVSRRAQRQSAEA